jgi:hypothetical protein
LLGVGLWADGEATLGVSGVCATRPGERKYREVAGDGAPREDVLFVVLRLNRGGCVGRGDSGTFAGVDAADPVPLITRRALTCSFIWLTALDQSSSWRL